MLIDYGPKKTYTSPQENSNRSRKEPGPPRKESSPLFLTVIVTGIISLTIGFGSGWMLSQRYAKKGFKAAMEQQSLENSPHQDTTVQPEAPKPQPVIPKPAVEPQKPQQDISSAPPGAQPAPEAPLSFYKNLPSGQKSNVLGSGINPTDEKTAKKPLQAAIPSNMAKQSQPQGSANTVKQSIPASAEMSATRQDNNGFTVQVASYSLKSEADVLRSKLASKGYNVYIIESNLGEKGTWYRVRVGKKLEPEAAKELAGKLGRGAISIQDKD